MTVLIDEINEIKKLMVNRQDGTISAEDYNAQMVGYNQLERRYRDILTAWALSHKTGVPLSEGVGKKLIGDGDFKKVKKLSNRTSSRGH